MASDNNTDELNELEQFIQNGACVEDTTCDQIKHSDADHFHLDNNRFDYMSRFRPAAPFPIALKAIIVAATLILAIVIEYSLFNAVDTYDNNEETLLLSMPKDDNLVEDNSQENPSETASHSANSGSYSAFRTTPTPIIETTTGPSISPTSTPTTSNGMFSDLSFYVMGDIPYSLKEERILMSQLQEIDGLIQYGKDKSIFIAHVGDFMRSSKTHCRESQYIHVAHLLRQHSPLPVLTIPGNDDYVNCEDSEKALGNFKRYILPLDKGTRLHPKIVRPDDREENFAFVQSEVLFIGLNMMPDPHPSKEDPVFQDCKKWLNDQLDLHLDHVRAVILFGHSANGKSVVFRNLNDRINEANIPLVMFQGDEHTHDFHPNFGYADEKDWTNLWRVVVDQGAIAPPIKVTILGNKDLSQGWREYDNGNVLVIGGFIKIDRRGGTYKGVAIADKER